MKANKSKGYYAKTDNGYLCPVCGKTYSGAFARRDTINCCHDKKPLSDLAFRAAEQILIDSYHVPTPRTKQPGDGELHKDKWGHWRRGKKMDSPPQVRAEYNKAFEKIAKEMDKEQQAILENMFYDLNDTIDEWLTTYHRERTPDQKIAYAFSNRNYNLLKIYIQDAIKQAVMERERYIRNNPDYLASKTEQAANTDLSIDTDWLNELKNKKGGI